MGAGHMVTALYELVPIGGPGPDRRQGGWAAVSEVRRGTGGPGGQGDQDGRGVRPEDAAQEAGLGRQHPSRNADQGQDGRLREGIEDFQFAASVASFAMMLRDSQYKGDSNFGLVLELANAAKKHDPSGYRAEFIELVKQAKALSGK